jgi:hypothetical protein
MRERVVSSVTSCGENSNREQIVRIAVTAIAAFFVFALPGGSVASTEASAVLELRVGSLDAAVTLDPTGRLLDPNCPENTCKFSYLAGTKVKLSAVNGASSLFVEWAGGCSGSSPACELTVSNNRYVRASFSRLTLTYGAVTKGGYVRLDSAGVGSCGSGCAVYAYGTTNILLRAVVDDDDFEFDQWGGACAGVRSTGCIFTSPMRFNRSVPAYFKRKDRLGSTQGPLVGTSKAFVRVTGSGTVSATIEGEDVKCSVAECQIDPLKGATVVLNAKPATGWRLYRWTGRCAGAAATCTFSNQAPRYYPWVRATFVPA